jgi:hypothetical protein
MFLKYSLAVIANDYRERIVQVQSLRVPIPLCMKAHRASDIFLAGTLRTIILGLICIFAATSVLLAYQSLVQLVAGHLAMLTAKLFWSFALAIACIMLVRYRAEIVDD